MTHEQKRLIGRECFGGGPRVSTRSQARVGPKPVAGGLSDSTRRCIVDILGRMPSGPDDLSDEEKRHIGQKCFERRPGTRRAQQPGAVRRVQPQTAPTPQQPADKGAAQAAVPPQATAAAAQQPAPAAGQEDSGSDEQPAPKAAAQPGQDSSGSTTAGRQQPGAGASQVVLNRVERDIKQIVNDHNRVELMSAVQVIDRFSNLTGSRIAGLILLNKVNHLLVKGKEVSDEEVSGVSSVIPD